MYNAFGMQDICITAIYVKCKSKDRRDLWHSLEQDNMVIDIPWCIGGDFNIIMDPNEKLGISLTECIEAWSFKHV